jgi:S-methylmethionine-dependent homocysteine/selenocysteine methylase
LPATDLPRGGSILLLDGAMGTELDRRGVNVALPLWSARALLDAPQVVRAIHEEYLDAGADLITANTFRTKTRTLRAAEVPPEVPRREAAKLARRAVELARAARDARRPEALVLGSVAPLEDCYRPDLAPDAETCRTEHAELIGDLLESGVDAILIETMNNLTEAAAAIGAAQERCPGRWMASFCTRGCVPAGTLLSGESLDEILDLLGSAAAAGVNCVAAPALEKEVRFLRSRLPQGVRIMAYANIGRADAQGNWIRTDAVDPRRYAEYARRWVAAGATIVGGCCGTTPAHIRAVAAVLRAPGTR